MAEHRESTPEAGAIAVPSADASEAEEGTLRDASLLRTLYRDPDHAPEHLVLIAVDKVGAQSQAGADRLRSEEPEAASRDLGEQVVARTVRYVRTDGAVMGTPFLLAVVPAFIAVLWHQAQMVLRIAALAGRDPTVRRRASEILLLQNAFKSLELADGALDAAGERVRGESQEPRLARGTRFRLIVRMVAVVSGGRKIKRLELAIGLLSWPVCMVFPLTAVPIMSAFYERATRKLGRRTLDYYLPAESEPEPGSAAAERDWRAILWYGVTIAVAILMIAVPLALLTTAAKPLGVSWDRAALGAIVLSVVIGLLLWSNRR